VIELWFALLTFLIVVFVVLDGWDFGAGALHLAVAKTPAERREVIAAIGPLWSWHEVWLVAAGGTFLLAFPRIMAAAFAGFYLALWLVLWSFVLRGIAIEVGGHIADRLWQSWWDFVFAVASLTLAILFGAALGNVIRGVPVDGTGSFSMPLFTDFRTTGRVGILDWYTLSMSVLATVILCAHGATYLRLKTLGPVQARSERLARVLWSIVLVLFPIISFETVIVRPDLYGSMVQQPIGWLAIAVVGAGVWALFTGLRARLEERAFAGSCAIVAGLLAGAAAGAFPVFLRSTVAPEYSLTAYNGATSSNGLAIALFWWPLALVLAFTYFTLIMRSYRGKVRPAHDTQGFY
jgi:cytochrome d ubiquinol oxidase subunit II